jgi:hypothetical protein
MPMEQNNIISFRVRSDDWKEFKRIAKILCLSGKLKKPSVGLMAKKFLYVMINQYRILETSGPYFDQKGVISHVHAAHEL